MIRKHSTILNSNRVKKVVCDERPLKDYRKSVACSVCCKVIRSDYLKKPMATKHKIVLNTADAVKKQLKTNVKMSYNSYECTVTSYTTYAMRTVTNTLHWALEHIHDETLTFLES